MATYLKIGIDDFWLTDSGEEDGLPCDLEVQGDLSSLKQKWWGGATRNARGNAEMNLTEVSGVELTFAMPMLNVATLNDVSDLFDDCLDDDSGFALRIDGGDIIDLNLQADPNPDNPIRWKEVIENFALDVEIRVITRAIEE